MGARNENGECFLGFCTSENNMVIGGGDTLFKHKNICNITQISPDRISMNQIGNVSIKQKMNFISRC